MSLLRQFTFDGMKVRVMEGLIYPNDVWFMRKKNHYMVGYGGIIINDGCRPVDRLFYQKVYSTVEADDNLMAHNEGNIVKFYPKE